MQEKKAPCFVVATANEVGSLPPEFLRRGRFDEVFFLDLPTMQERKEIFNVHITKRKRNPHNFDIDVLAAAADGYVGAEIEQSIIDAMYIGFDQKREFTTDDVLSALNHQIPLSVSAKEQVDHLRRWVRDGRAQVASYPDGMPSQSMSGAHRAISGATTGANPAPAAEKDPDPNDQKTTGAPLPNWLK
jgi:hypothetical protein